MEIFLTLVTSPISNTPDKDGRHTYRVDVLGIDEGWVDDAIQRAGGYRIADKHSFPEGVANCDYRLEDLFIELKILEKDVFESPERQEKIVKFFDSEGLIAAEGTSTVDSRQLSIKQRYRYWDIMLNGIEGIVKKANRQIRETVKHLGVAEFKGLILLVNKECESIEGLTLRKYAEHIIRKEKFSSLHHAVCFSAIPAVAPGNPPVIGFYPGDTHSDKMERQIEHIALAFKTKIEEILGKKLSAAPKDLGPVSNIRDDRTFTHGATAVTFASGSKLAIEQNREKMKDRRGGSTQ